MGFEPTGRLAPAGGFKAPGPCDVIALFEFEVTEEQVTIRDEKHYRLVAPDELTPDELAQYRRSARI